MSEELEFTLYINHVTKVAVESTSLPMYLEECSKHMGYRSRIIHIIPKILFLIHHANGWHWVPKNMYALTLGSSSK